GGPGTPGRSRAGRKLRRLDAPPDSLSRQTESPRPATRRCGPLLATNCRDRKKSAALPGRCPRGRRNGLVGHLFQGRFKSPAVQADRYALSCGRYIERNPVEAHLEKDPWHYRWWSCHHYALGEADPLLAVNPWYEQLTLEQSRRQTL